MMYSAAGCCIHPGCFICACLRYHCSFPRLRLVGFPADRFTVASLPIRTDLGAIPTDTCPGTIQGSTESHHLKQPSTPMPSIQRYTEDAAHHARQPNQSSHHAPFFPITGQTSTSPAKLGNVDQYPKQGNCPLSPIQRTLVGGWPC